MIRMERLNIFIDQCTSSNNTMTTMEKNLAEDSCTTRLPRDKVFFKQPPLQ